MPGYVYTIIGVVVGSVLGSALGLLCFWLFASKVDVLGTIVVLGMIVGGVWFSAWQRLHA